ncbi:hypothetical protein SASPL_120174 [Salvia splendens]|uniref:Uncharacterized protein n=1 Tax=Salvia splendens TaxID=180675 RepID=A0A8X8ZTQ7_SALSN|nr:hypothetical protein SASPL_120174 [Salvia splendens]
MKTLHTLFPFLLLSILLLAFQQHYANSATFQETTKGKLEFHTIQRKSAIPVLTRPTTYHISAVGNSKIAAAAFDTGGNSQEDKSCQDINAANKAGTLRMEFID